MSQRSDTNRRELDPPAHLRRSSRQAPDFRQDPQLD